MSNLMELFFKSEDLGSLIRASDAALTRVFEDLSTRSMRILLLQRVAAMGEANALRLLVSLVLVDLDEFCVPNVASEGNFEHLVHTAVRYRQIECLKILLEELADVNLKSSHGSVLHEACILDDAQSVKLLLAWNASSDAVCNDLTPLEDANLLNSCEAASVMSSEEQNSLFAMEQGALLANAGQRQTESNSPPLSSFLEYFRNAAPKLGAEGDHACSYFANGLFESISISEEFSFNTAHVVVADQLAD